MAVSEKVGTLFFWEIPINVSCDLKRCWGNKQCTRLSGFCSSICHLSCWLMTLLIHYLSHWVTRLHRFTPTCPNHMPRTLVSPHNNTLYNEAFKLNQQFLDENGQPTYPDRLLLCFSMIIRAFQNKRPQVVWIHVCRFQTWVA